MMVNKWQKYSNIYGRRYYPCRLFEVWGDPVGDVGHVGDVDQAWPRPVLRSYIISSHPTMGS